MQFKREQVTSVIARLPSRARQRTQINIRKLQRSLPPPLRGWGFVMSGSWIALGG